MLYLAFVVALSAVPRILSQALTPTSPASPLNLLEPFTPPPSQIETLPPHFLAPFNVITDDSTSSSSDAPPTPVSEAAPSSKQSPSRVRPPTGTSQHPQYAIWAASPVFDDLSSFGITKFASGPKNLRVVTGIPAFASATASPTQADGRSFLSTDKTQAWKNDTTVLQLFYPKGSVNPSKKPVGGTQFYASPINITTARNVTMEYCIFFPADFDFVRGGKLPGLYGGTMGCSGGNSAEDCFSTRLMWRRKGMGELYLYGPRGKQTKDLCSAPGSECGGGYGTSIGRGTFTFARGAWTCVAQTVTLNTPGKQDGQFLLHVNGKLAVQREDILYRGKALDPDDDVSDDDDESGTTEEPTSTSEDAGPTNTTSTTSPSPTAASNQTGLIDSLGNLVNSILGGAPQSSQPLGRRILRMQRRQTNSDATHTPSADELKAALEKIVEIGESVLGTNSTEDTTPSSTQSNLSPTTRVPAAVLEVTSVSEPSPAASLSPSPTLLPPSLAPTTTTPLPNSTTTTSPSSLPTNSEDEDHFLDHIVNLGQFMHDLEVQESELAGVIPQFTSSLTVSPSSTGSSIDPSSTASDGPQTTHNITDSASRSSPKQVGFRGIFFSSFFGGHGPEWASPKDQYVWFKDLALARNE